MLYCCSFSAVIARSFEWLTDCISLIKTKLNRLINSVCFRVRSITKKEKQWIYSLNIHREVYSTWYIKVHSEEWNRWCMKVIWEIQYKFGDVELNWLTWCYWSIFCAFNISYRKRRHKFPALFLYKH